MPNNAAAPTREPARARASEHRGPCGFGSVAKRADDCTDVQYRAARLRASAPAARRDQAFRCAWFPDRLLNQSSHPSVTTRIQTSPSPQAAVLDNVAGLHDALASQGYASIPIPGAEDPLEQATKLAKALGEPRAPKLGGQAVNRLQFRAERPHPLSMSARFPDGNFPLHTDTAHWPTPCRYVLLFSAGHAELCVRPTVVLDLSLLLHDGDLHRLACGVWRTRTCPHFVTPIAHRRKTRWAFRWDEGILEPISARAREAHEIIPRIVAAAKPVEVQWAHPQILVLDNWRILHSRAPAARNTDRERQLWRILVMQRE